MDEKFPTYLKIAISYSDFSQAPSLLDELEKVFNFSYKPMWFDWPRLGKTVENGTWTGIFGAVRVQRGECDIVTDFDFIEERAEIMDFSFPYIFIDLTFVTSKPSKLLRTFAFIDAFSVQLWIAVLVFYIFFSLMGHRFWQSK